MKTRSFFTILIWLAIWVSAKAQATGDINNLEQAYKACLLTGKDTSNCGKTFLRQMDSTLSSLYERVRLQLSAKEKADFLNEHKSWLAKRSDFNKKQDENFTFNLQEGTWKPNMIWLVYENKADFIRKRALVLAKRLKE
jgi:uncharacterized protein YecT (DUF1311 family)